MLPSLTASSHALCSRAKNSKASSVASRLMLLKASSPGVGDAAAAAGDVDTRLYTVQVDKSSSDMYLPGHTTGARAICCARGIQGFTGTKRKSRSQCVFASACLRESPPNAPSPPRVTISTDFFDRENRRIWPSVPLLTPDFFCKRNDTRGITKNECLHMHCQHGLIDLLAHGGPSGVCAIITPTRIQSPSSTARGIPLRKRSSRCTRPERGCMCMCVCRFYISEFI